MRVTDPCWCCGCIAPGTTTSRRSGPNICGPAPWSRREWQRPNRCCTPEGEDFVQVESRPPAERRWAGLARWVDGELLAEVVARETDAAANVRHFAQLGAIMAAMHDQATVWTPPAGFQRHALDADGLLGPTPFWGPFWDHAILSPAERRLLLATRDTLHAALTRYGKPATTFSLIHADLHPRNVVINGTHAAVIDFDDAGFGWHLYDLAVALVAYQHHPEFTASGTPASRDIGRCARSRSRTSPCCRCFC